MFCGNSPLRTRNYERIDLEVNELGSKIRQPTLITFRIAIVNDNIFAFHVAKTAQPLPQCIHSRRMSGCCTNG
jgi:hypothetical protein